MSPFSIALVGSMGLFISDVSCVTLTADKMVRSEKKEMEISDSGEMRLTPHASDDVHDSTADMCDVDFPLGGAGGCACSDETSHELILQEEMCRVAAAQAGVTAPDNFRLKSEWFNHHPKGCFVDTCSDTKGVCYFYNPIGNLPAQCGNWTMPNGDQPQVTGHPVCQRARYQNGTIDGNDGCANDYGVVMDETNCSEAAICLGYCEGTEFRVTSLNQSRHDDFPVGCFINTAPGQDGCVYYNPPLENWEPPRTPVGTPVCNVTVRTWIDSAGDISGGSVNVDENRVDTTTTTTLAP